MEAANCLQQRFAIALQGMLQWPELFLKQNVMRQVSVSEVKEDFAYIMDSAQQEPILVKEHDRNYVAIISMNDYEDLVKIKNLRLKNISADLGAEAQANGLTLELLNEILNSDA